MSNIDTNEQNFYFNPDNNYNDIYSLYYDYFCSECCCPIIINGFFRENNELKISYKCLNSSNNSHHCIENFKMFINRNRNYCLENKCEKGEKNSFK